MTEIPIACTLNKADLDKRQDELNALIKSVCGVRQIQNGFALQFDGSTKNVMAIARIIAQERLCCRFLHFQLIAEPNAGHFGLKYLDPARLPNFY